MCTVNPVSVLTREDLVTAFMRLVQTPGMGPRDKGPPPQLFNA